MKKENRRDYYRQVFEDLFNKFNYVQQSGEEIKQLEEVDYYFISNKGYLFSVYGEKLKIVAPRVSKGRSRHHYKIGNKEMLASRLINMYFPTNDYNPKNISKDELERHHIHPYDYSLSNQKNNSHVNLQALDPEAHKILSALSRCKLEEGELNGSDAINVNDKIFETCNTAVLGFFNQDGTYKGASCIELKNTNMKLLLAKINYSLSQYSIAFGYDEDGCIYLTR